VAEGDYDPPLVHLPGTKLTPDVVLHRTLNKVPRMKGVIVLIQWDDDTWAIDWSLMTTADMAFAAKTLDIELTDVITQRKPAS